MAKYRKKPVEIEAIHYTGQSLAEVDEFVHDANAVYWDDTDERLMVWNHADGQWLVVPDEFWLIKGVHGEVYPCHPDVFAATYEPV